MRNYPGYTDPNVNNMSKLTLLLSLEFFLKFLVDGWYLVGVELVVENG